MSYLQAIILGLVQGITEFLPVSSSGHLAILQSFFGLESTENHLLFDVLLHLGTLGAVLITYWGDIAGLTREGLVQLHLKKPRRGQKPDLLKQRMILFILLATLPLVLAGKGDMPTCRKLAEGVIAGLPAKTEWVNYAPGIEHAANRIGSPAEATPEQVVIGSVREGMVPGIHTVTYESEDDILELKHTIKNRRTLAMGAVIAAEFLCGKQGVYSMDDLLK